MQSLEQQLTRVDINLINAFQVLMQERSVTRAANRLFISQPAMSTKLQHLRKLFNDPLFIRTREGLMPTPKATQLISPVESILSQLATLILQPPFAPSQATGSVSLQVPDSFSVTLVPPLYRRLRKFAPRLKLTSDNTTEQHLELLASARADFSIYIADDYGSDFMTFDLGASSSVCWMRSGHPLAGKREVSIDEVLEYPLAELTFHKYSPRSHTQTRAIRQLLELHETHRLDATARLGSTQLLTILAIVRETDTLLLGAPFPSKAIPHRQGLTYRQVREFKEIRIPLVLIQHRRTETSEMHAWLRQQIIECWAEATRLRS